MIDDELMKRLREAPPDSSDRSVVITGRLHMIEVDQPGRRVGIRAQDGIDWTCQYPDELHDLVTSQSSERLVRVKGKRSKAEQARGTIGYRTLGAASRTRPGFAFQRRASSAR